MTSEKYSETGKGALNLPIKGHSHTAQDVTATFLPVIRILRLLGCCPLIITLSKDKFNGTKKYEYSFKWISFPVFYSFFVFLVYSLLSWYIIVCQVLQGKYARYMDLQTRSISQEVLGKPHSNVLHDWSISTFVLIYYLWLWMNPILLNIRSGYVAKFMQNVSVFGQQFKDTFPGKKVDFSAANASVKFIFIANFLALSVLISGIVHLLAPCLFRFKGQDHRLYCHDFTLLDSWVSIIGIMVGATTSFSQDTMLYSFFRSIENILVEVKNEMDHASKFLIHTKNIRDWAKIGRTLKRQADILNHIIGLEELAALLMNFLTWIFFCFMLLNISRYPTAVLLSAGSFCFSNMIRLYVKTTAVTRITAAEKEIRILFVKMETETHSSYAECERIFLVNVMACRPIRFTLCNVVTLDSSLTSWLIGGIVTYLMVLLQFQDLIAADEK